MQGRPRCRGDGRPRCRCGDRRRTRRCTRCPSPAVTVRFGVDRGRRFGDSVASWNTRRGRGGQVPRGMVTDVDDETARLGRLNLDADAVTVTSAAVVAGLRGRVGAPPSSLGGKRAGFVPIDEHRPRRPSRRDPGRAHARGPVPIDEHRPRRPSRQAHAHVAGGARCGVSHASGVGAPILPCPGGRLGSTPGLELSPYRVFLHGSGRYPTVGDEPNDSPPRRPRPAARLRGQRSQPGPRASPRPSISPPCAAGRADRGASQTARPARPERGGGCR